MATANGMERARALSGVTPSVVTARSVPTMPGPMGLGGTVPPAPTPKPMNASSPTAPTASAVGMSPRMTPTPNASTRHLLV